MSTRRVLATAPFAVLAVVAVMVFGTTVSAKGPPLPNRAYGHGEFVQAMSRITPLPAAKMQLQPAMAASGAAPIVNREVLGYLPYWSISKGYTIQRWDLLTVLAWFGAEMDSTGDITALHGWGGAATAALVQDAHAHGVKVIVTITNFDDAGIGTLLQSPTYRANAINSCLDLMATHSADGINIDFEFVPASAKQEFVTFMAELKSAVTAVQPNGSDGHVSLAGPSVDWNGAYDYDQLLINTDGIMVMAYGYHYSGSSTPGPTSPLVGGGGFSGKSISTTVDEYIQFGGYENRHKVMIGLPWYGRDWKVANTNVPGNSLGDSGAIFYEDAELESAGTKQWHDLSKTSYYHIERSSGLYQTWYDDAEAFQAKIEFVESMDLGGIGIWALGYDGTDPALWDAIETVFTDPTVADPGPEPGPEPAVEEAPDAIADMVTETVADSGAEAAIDAASDLAGPEPVPDSGAEVIADAGSDDGSPDSGLPDSGSDVVADSKGPSEGVGTGQSWHHSGTSSLVTQAQPGCAGGQGQSSRTLLWFALLLLFLGATRRRQIVVSPRRRSPLQHRL